MTLNQIRYQELQENKRSNLAQELETNRSNMAREGETSRHNRAGEMETKRSNLAQELETNRSNMAREEQARKELVADTAMRTWDNINDTGNVALKYIQEFNPLSSVWAKITKGLGG